MKANDDERLRRLRELYEESGAPCRYQRVAEALEVSIRQGVFRPGDALPTQRALAARLNVTTGTATHGYAEAAKRGLVTGVTGRGSFVSAGELAACALMTALLIGGQLVLSSAAGVEVVTVMFLAFCTVYGRRAGMLTATAFSLLRCILFGFFHVLIYLYSHAIIFRFPLTSVTSKFS